MVHIGSFLRTQENNSITRGVDNNPLFIYNGAHD